ncbi:Acetyl-CoA acetyltransferase [Sinosporangium album]|uniref:Acetyl-CoA acetyltransferase n=1 Tax=Sinosporangium album TaxID=504805 RepID=A0A1G8IT74_9ACTN|nr:thiolase family protein [Sinosporangium album]SDI22073.1 Acetyl-CoA acetyltransferase [Sinosporangium album]
MTEVVIAGVGMTAFGRHLGRSLKQLGSEAVELALADSGVDLADIDIAFASNVAGSLTTGQVSVVGQTVFRELGMSRTPVFNVDNACASSSSAFHLAVMALRAGQADTALVMGVEKLFAEDRTAAYRALNGCADVDRVAEAGIDVGRQSVFVASIYPERIKRYADRFRLDPRSLAEIAVKNRQHAGLNPMAQNRKPLSVEDVLESRVIVSPITALMCSPISDGATAVVLTTRKRRPGASRPVHVRGTAIGMGGLGSPGQSSIEAVARRAYAQAGIGPEDIGVAEVHDSTSFNELLAYEELGFAEPGRGADLVAAGDTRLGGRLPVNPSGGLQSRGHPIAATGLAQLIELTQQLRGESGQRQVDDPRFAVAENAGGFAGDDTAAIAVTVLSDRAD